MIGESEIGRGLELIGQQEAFGPNFSEWMKQENIDELALSGAADDHVFAATMEGVHGSRMSFLAGFVLCLMILRHVQEEEKENA